MKTLLFSILMGLSISATADIYKCVSPNSAQLVYQDTPCNELTIEELVNLPPTAAGVTVVTDEMLAFIETNEKAEAARTAKLEKAALNQLD